MELHFKIKMEFLNKSILSSRSSHLDNQQGKIYLTGNLDTPHYQSIIKEVSSYKYRTTNGELRADEEHSPCRIRFTVMLILLCNFNIFVLSHCNFLTMFPTGYSSVANPQWQVVLASHVCAQLLGSTSTYYILITYHLSLCGHM